MDLGAGLNQHQTIVFDPHRTNFQRADPAADRFRSSLESDLTDAERLRFDKTREIIVVAI